MRKIIAVVLCLSAFAMVASATANRIEFYFSKNNQLGSIPTEYTGGTVPTINIGETAYLWAYVQGTAARWSAVAVIFNGPAITNGFAYDPITTDPDSGDVVWRRWNDGGIKNAVGNYLNLVGVPVSPVTGLGDATQDTLCTGTTRHFLIGEMQFGSAGSVFLNVGTGFIIKVGTSNPPTDDIYFGFGTGGKEHIVKAGGALAYGSDVGASTATADLFVVPEPASLLLIGLAGLALRRR